MRAKAVRMADRELIELVTRIAKKRLGRSNRLERWARLLEENIVGETPEERDKRLADAYWKLFDEIPSFARRRPASKSQASFPFKASSSRD